MKRFHITISGTVTDVNFRYYAKQKANELYIKGWIRNTGFKKVEAVIEGQEDALREFVTWCKEGPAYADVEDISVEEEEYVEEFKDFEVHF